MNGSIQFLRPWGLPSRNELKDWLVSQSIYIPKAYEEFLLSQNGGYFNSDLEAFVRIPKSLPYYVEGDDKIFLAGLYGLGGDEGMSIEEMWDLYLDVTNKNYLPIGVDDLGGTFFLGLNDASGHGVYFKDLSFPAGLSEDQYFNNPISKSFIEFVCAIESGCITND